MKNPEKLAIRRVYNFNFRFNYLITFEIVFLQIESYLWSLRILLPVWPFGKFCSKCMKNIHTHSYSYMNARALSNALLGKLEYLLGAVPTVENIN